MELHKRSRRPSSSDDGPREPTPASAPVDSKSKQTDTSPVDLRSLFILLLAFRMLNALLTRTFFQPDEHYQTTEIAHRLVFGYGYKSWEWWPSTATHSSSSDPSYLSASLHNLLNGPVRSILHPLLFVPGYLLLKLTGLDNTYLLILFPRLQQALFAAIGDLYTFRLARRIGGTQVAWLTTLVGLSNFYTLFTATRTFSNCTEAAITAAALFYWPFVPFFSYRFDVHTFASEKERKQMIGLQAPGCEWKQMAPKQTVKAEGQSQYDREFDVKQVSRTIYDRSLRKSLWLAAAACLLRPTNGVLWVYLVTELLVRQIRALKSNQSTKGGKEGGAEEGSLVPTLELVGEAGSLLRIVAKVGFSAIGLALAVDTVYDLFANQHDQNRILPALSLVSFLHKNVVANLSIFYGANPWHFYLTQGVPVLCTIWLPATVFGLIEAFSDNTAGMGTMARRSLARLICVTVGVYSLLGHKEFRFLQPLLPPLSVLAACGLASSYAGKTPSNAAEGERGVMRSIWHALNMLPVWLRLIVLTFSPIAAMYVNTIHSIAQEQVPYELGRLYRSQQLHPPAEQEFTTGLGRIHNLGFLMPCHSTPWATHMHDKQLVERSWFIHCPPPPARSQMTPAQQEVEYWDQSDFFYHDPIKYLVDRLPYNVDASFPPPPPPPPTAGWADEGEVSPWDKGWRHSWPSHLVVFESLLKENTRRPGHTRTLRNLLSLKGYREVKRWWNTPKHEDSRRDGDIVLLEYKGPKDLKY